jgi:hypothetical protein
VGDRQPRIVILVAIEVGLDAVEPLSESGKTLTGSLTGGKMAKPAC